MKKLLFLLILLPFFSSGHPGIAIVKDSKGNIFYSDLEQVWKITNGKKTVVVPHVHTHELYIDRADNLFGEHVIYEGEATDKYHHYLWVLKPNGILDTAISQRQAYIHNDYSLARDVNGNEYFIRQFTAEPDFKHIYKRSPDGKEVVFATGNFKGVSWLHPQTDGSLLYVSDNKVFRISANGIIKQLAANISSAKPTFRLTGNSIIVYGIWQDIAKNVYVAAFSDQAVKKITPAGTISTYYRSKGNWAPTQGVFDDKDRLWLLESSDKNEVRVVLVKSEEQLTDQKKSYSWLFGLLAGFGSVGLILIAWIFRNNKQKISYN